MKNHKVRRAVSNYSTVLTHIFDLMFSCGLNRRDILSASAQALERARMPKVATKRDNSGDLATVALALDRWHRDRRYITSSGCPRAIPLLGPPPSVEALIRAQSGRKRAVTLARSLRAQNILVPCGDNFFKPTSNVALLTKYDTLAVQHVTRSLSMLLETIRRNLARGSTSQRLIERIAEVPDLPLSEVQAFRKFTQTQGLVLLRTVNDWLEARRLQAQTIPGQKTVRAGIHVHTYVGASRRATFAGAAGHFRMA